MAIKVWKDKEGKKITAGEFANRFKEGMKGITPAQKVQQELNSTFIMLVGYIVGFISLIIFRNDFLVSWFTYGLMVIFFGAAWGNTFKVIALRQQLKLLKNFSADSIDVKEIMKSFEIQEKGGQK